MQSAVFDYAAADDACWDALAERCWGERPALLRSVHLPVSATTLFGGLQNACSDAQSHRPVELRLYRGNALVHSGVLSTMPTIQESPQACVKRIRQALDGAEFAFIVGDFHRHCTTLWNELSALLYPLHQRVGLPADTLVSALWGAYTRGAFGMHKDGDHTLFIAIHGTKAFWVWPRQFLETDFLPPTSVGGVREYDHWTKQAHRFQLRPGDALYIPAGLWHAAESDGQLSGGLSLGLAKPAASLSVAALARALPSIFLPIHNRFYPGATDAQPPSLSAEAQRLRSAVHNLDELIDKEWVRHCSAAGFQSTPTGRPVPDFDDSTTLVPATGGRLSWLVRADHLLCGVCGNVLDLPASPDVLFVLGEAANRQEVTIAGLAQRTEQMGAKGVRALLELLYANRYLEISGGALH